MRCPNTTSEQCRRRASSHRAPSVFLRGACRAFAPREVAVAISLLREGLPPVGVASRAGLPVAVVGVIALVLALTEFERGAATLEGA